MLQSQYATVLELVRFSLTPSLAELFSGSAGTDGMLAAITAASSEADSYLRSQQILPLTEWDDKLRQIVCDIAAFRLFSNYGYNPDAVQNQNIINRYNQAIKWLQMVASEEIKVMYPDSDPRFLKAGSFVKNSQSPVGFGDDCQPRVRRWFR